MKHIIFDGSNVLWRAHWVASQYSPEYKYQDVSIFMTMIHSICTMLNCYSVYIAWDDREMRGQSNPRRTMAPNYKQNRTQESTCYQHIDIIKDLTNSLGITHVRPYALEGDDVISILCDQLQGDKIIVTADQDLAQLVSDSVSYYSVTKKVLITSDNFSQYFPVSVDKFVTYKCIVGDASDNIPGVPRFGPKRASKLCDQIHLDPTVVDTDIITLVESNRKLMDLKALITDQEKDFIQKQLHENFHAPDIQTYRSICRDFELNKVMNLNVLSFLLS